MKHIFKPALSLFIIAAVVTTLLGLVRLLTLEPIAQQTRKTQEKTMKVILPEASAFSEIAAADKKYKTIDKIYRGTADGQNIGYILELSPDGYSGAINMMLGISTLKNEIAGMRILKHTETPGLGALAVKEKFYRVFDSRKIIPLAVVRGPASENEIQAISGATITTRAITGAVNEAIDWYAAFSKTQGAEQP